MYNKTCPYCGAYLDPGEQCDCQNKSVNSKTAIVSSNNIGREITTYNRKKAVPKNETCYTQY